MEEACRELGVAGSGYRRWRNQYGGLQADEVERLKELGEGNERLERVVADLTPDEPIPEEAARGN